MDKEKKMEQLITPVKKLETEETPTHEIMTLDKLNDDCLIKIFERLDSIRDKIKIERVCKRWQILSKHSWRHFKKLDFTFDTWDMPGKDLVVIDNNIMEKVVNLCGRYLTTVSLSLEAFKKICRFSPNIQELHLYDLSRHCDSIDNWRYFKKGHNRTSLDLSRFNKMHLTDWSYSRRNCGCTDHDWKEIVEWLTKNSKNIKKFYLKLFHDFYEEEDLTRVLMSMKNLNVFFVTDCKPMKLQFTCLNQLSPDVQEIHLHGVSNLSTDLLSKVIKSCKQLRKISLMVLKSVGIDNLLEAISFHAESLQNLRLTCSLFLFFGRFNTGLGENITSGMLSRATISISKLKCLEHLQLTCLYLLITDDFLKAVADNCIQLISLDIACAIQVTDEGLSNVSNLKKLRILNLERTNIRRPPLEKFRNLEVLDCSCCYELEDESICLFLKSAPYIRTIDLIGCELMTVNVLKAAARAVEMRNSDLPLDIYLEEFLCEGDTTVYPALLNINRDSDDYFECSTISYVIPDIQIKLPQVRFHPKIFSKFHAEP